MKESGSFLGRQGLGYMWHINITSRFSAESKKFSLAKFCKNEFVSQIIVNADCYACGCKKSINEDLMKKDFVILVDQSDHPIGEMEKMEAHQLGLMHRAFSVFIFNRSEATC